MISDKQSKYYVENKKYTQILDSQTKDYFLKYIALLKKYIPINGSFLDVGCGTGNALKLLSKGKYKLYGVEISKTSISICKKKGLNAKLYDGRKIPFKDNYFDVVGSINVLEHTYKPVHYLDEQVRVLKSGGYLFILCPNFLSVTNSYHHHTRGIVQKMKNIYNLVKKGAFKHGKLFEKMPTIEREDFHPDDDACNVTNPVDIIRWSKSRKLKIMYWSSQQTYLNSLVNKLDIGILKLFLGSCYFVLKK